MNKRDAINQIKQFGGRLDRFRRSGGSSGDGGRNAPKRAKPSPKPNSRKTNVFNEQVRYAFRGALQDLKSKPLATFLTVMVIAISLTLPSVCYMVYKNVNQQRRSITRLRRSPFICKKRWMMMRRQASSPSCRLSRVWKR